MEVEPATEISGLFHMESNVAQAAEGNRWKSEGDSRFEEIHFDQN